MTARAISCEEWRMLAIAAHFHPGELGELAGMTRHQLWREILRKFGKTPREWLAEERFKCVRSCLAAGESVKQAAAHVGFHQPPSFCRWLHQYELRAGSQHPDVAEGI